MGKKKFIKKMKEESKMDSYKNLRTIVEFRNSGLKINL